jgi:1,2-dihydroxy-3-keto-5-methylthiopentene dioxygenase
MKAYWLDDGKEVTVDELKAEGVDYEKIDASNFQTSLDRIKAANGYVSQDIVELTPQMANLETILAKFDKEHLHTDDEVRYVLAGSGIFDIRSQSDRWMRVEVYASDYISVPANRHHRFFVMDDKFIRCVRLFKDNSGWTPLYRTPAEQATV